MLRPIRQKRACAIASIDIGRAKRSQDLGQSRRLRAACGHDQIQRALAGGQGL
jgi:hypothetical protein